MAPARRRSTLFVGALALGDVPAALASGADMVCIDLEHAAPAERAGEVRDAVIAAVRGSVVPAGVMLIARGNDHRKPEGTADVKALLREPKIAGLMLPQLDCADDVRSVAQLADEAGSEAEFYPIIETTSGLEQCRAIAAAHPRVEAIFFGANDLSVALGCVNAWEPLLEPRMRAVQAAVAAAVPALDAPFAARDDLAGLRADCERVKALGIGGKAAKYAVHVPTIHDVFS